MAPRAREALSRASRSASTLLASEVDSIDPEIPPPMFVEAGQERQRLEMLPLALVLGLGLVIGYATGYIVGTRERPQLASEVTDTQRPASPSQSGQSSPGAQAPTTARRRRGPPPNKSWRRGSLLPPLASAPPSAAPTGIPPSRPASTPPAPRASQQPGRSSCHIQPDEGVRDHQRQVERADAADDRPSQVRKARDARRSAVGRLPANGSLCPLIQLRKRSMWPCGRRRSRLAARRRSLERRRRLEARRPAASKLLQPPPKGNHSPTSVAARGRVQHEP